MIENINEYKCIVIGEYFKGEIFTDQVLLIRKCDYETFNKHLDIMRKAIEQWTTQGDYCSASSSFNMIRQYVKLIGFEHYFLPFNTMLFETGKDL
jgi:hypothetical protein